MAERIYTANKTRSNRPGWSVTFRHPARRDARGRIGLRIRRGLGTSDDSRADDLVAQLNQLLSDESWWSLDRRSDAESRFDNIVVDAFFDGIEIGKENAKELRENMLPLPTPDDGYARVMLVGSTGAGKTTLLRQLIGSDHTRDRFPSTSTAKTTTSDIEIITTADGPYKAAVTFMTEHEVRGFVDECLEQACESAIRGRSDEEIAAALLEHSEQRFRLSYSLGAWPQESSEAAQDLELTFYDEPGGSEALSDDEVVNDTELTNINRRLTSFVGQIKHVSTVIHDQIAPELGRFQDLSTANQRNEWIERFVDSLHDNQGFTTIALDVMDAVRDRFDLITEGDFERNSVWPTLWYHEAGNRDAFLKQVRWFTGNHSRQFGRLLTPIVNGIRVSGPFKPNAIELQSDDHRLVLLDGEGLGHSAREATSISTRVTERFQEADMILLIDNAQSPMQAAAIELVRSVGTSGHGHKLGVVFTHFDQVRGDNLSNHPQKVEHVFASVRNALSSMREAIGVPVTEILSRQLQAHQYYLGGLDQATSRIPRGYIGFMRNLMDAMQQSAEPPEPVDVTPHYSIARLELVLRDATDGFKKPWFGRLGLEYHEQVAKEHWARVKALCRRIAFWSQNEYNDLRPVADLVSQLQTGISTWLDNPAGWNRQPADDERATAIDQIRQEVFSELHTLSDRRLAQSHRDDWRIAYDFRGTGSSMVRGRQMAGIYNAAAPSISSAMDAQAQAFLDEVIAIVKQAVENAGGSLQGVARS